MTGRVGVVPLVPTPSATITNPRRRPRIPLTETLSAGTEFESTVRRRPITADPARRPLAGLFPTLDPDLTPRNLTTHAPRSRLPVPISSLIPRTPSPASDTSYSPEHDALSEYTTRRDSFRQRTMAARHSIHTAPLPPAPAVTHTRNSWQPPPTRTPSPEEDAIVSQKDYDELPGSEESFSRRVPGRWAANRGDAGVNLGRMRNQDWNPAPRTGGVGTVRLVENEVGGVAVRFRPAMERRGVSNWSNSSEVRPRTPGVGGKARSTAKGRKKEVKKAVFEQGDAEVQQMGGRDDAPGKKHVKEKKLLRRWFDKCFKKR